MARFERLRFEVEAVVLVGLDDERQSLDHLDAVLGEVVHLARVVSAKPDRLDAQGIEHVRRDGVVALVVTKAESDIGFDGVQERESSLQLVPAVAAQ